MRILFVGDLWSGSNALSLAEGFSSNGHDVRSVDTMRWTHPRRMSPAWWEARSSGRVPLNVDRVLERTLKQETEDWRPDLLVCFNTFLFRKRHSSDCPARIRIHYSPDDVSNDENVTKHYLEGESSWDLIVTTKRHNVPELVTRGVRNPLFVWSAYDPRIHVGVPASLDRPYTLGFIGAYRPDRSGLPRQMSERIPRQGIIHGPRWRRRYPFGVSGVAMRDPANGSFFRDATSAMAAGLVLLNSANRDQHTCRSFEMPASGLLTLAQRTPEHEELLIDEEECVLFDSQDDLWEKMQRLGRSPSEFRRIAERGWQRITGGGHTYQDRAKTIVEAATSLHPNGG